MNRKSNRSSISSPSAHVASAIRTCLMDKGWTQEELARQAGISRTTLHHLLQGDTETPHLATLSKIALALEVTPESLCPDFVARSTERAAATQSKTPASIRDQKLAFDKATNTYISEVYSDIPDLFSGWSFEDWTELYSTFGEGGALSPEGVVETAKLQNQKRDVIRKLHVVLETDLSDVAVNMIDTLFEMVQPSGNSASTAQLQALLKSPTPSRKSMSVSLPAESSSDE